MYGNLTDYRSIFAELDLHHVGILTDNLPRLRWKHKDRLNHFEAECFMTDDKLEFIVPYGGPLLDRLRASGPRLHHLAYKVHDLVQEMEQYIDQGFEFLSAGPVTGIGNTLVNFIMPEDRGVMIELVQECQ